MKKSLIALGLMMMGGFANAEIIGSVNTTFKLVGANDKIIVEAFDDPKIQGVSCYLSRAKTGGISGSMGLAEDSSDAALSCQQVGEIVISDKVEPGEDVFEKDTSIWFKTMKVVRFIDQKRNVIAYLVYSSKIIDGSPKNSTSTVAIRPWNK
ncbi:hypothetical protein D3C87_605230 [compost metagenome]